MGEIKGTNINKIISLQIAVKSVNDIAGLNGLIPILIVFGAYPRMTDNDPPSDSIAERARILRRP